jgi:hypothetical protein
VYGEPLGAICCGRASLGAWWLSGVVAMEVVKGLLRWRFAAPEVLDEG